jgi:hypothetical protein
MRYRLRTLVIATAIGPPLLAAIWFWGLAVFLFWLMPKNQTWAIVIGVVNGAGFMLLGALWQWWWATYVARRPKQSK